MRFADPIWLAVGAACVLALFALLVRAERKRTQALALLAGSKLRLPRAAHPSGARRWLRVAILTFAVAMGFGALARPQKGMHWETMDRKGTDLLLVVDTSKSMDADDVKPSRLARSKIAIADLVNRFPSDRIGLVAFAGDATVMSPMTLDHDALLETVDALDTQSVARGGTNIGRAIDVATDALRSEPGHQKAMVLLSDGEDIEGQGLDEAKKAQAEGITIDTVGVGSPAGEIVPARDDRGRIIGVVRDENGAPVRSKLDESGMRAIADATHGTYRSLGADGQGLERLYAEALAPRTHIEAASRTHRVYSELFAIPLALSLIALLFDGMLALPWRRITWKSRRSARVLAAAGAAALMLCAPRMAQASVSSAQKAYASGKYEEAAKEYAAESAKDPKDARIAFNAGDAAYRGRQYDAALAAFTRALGTKDPALKEHVLYNKGDVLYRAGETHLGDASDEKHKTTKEQWTSAIESYDSALKLDSKDEDARFNRDFVKKKLAELDKKDEENKQQQDQKQKNDDKQKQDDQKKGGGQGKNDKPNQGSGNDKAKQGGDKGKQDQGAQNRATPNQPGFGANGQNGQKPGEISPSDARALLSALKGDEHRGAVHARPAATGDAGAPTDDAPKKDW